MANQILGKEGLEHPWATALVECQFRLAWESGHPILGDIAFTEDDHFLAGIVVLVPYKLLGLVRGQTETILEAVEIQVLLAQDGSNSIVPQTILETVVKDVYIASVGPVAWKQWGFISQLPTGDYRTVTEISRPLFFEDQHTWTVHFRVD
ncbi:MAG: hypothetical protein R3314_13020 [Longimicrobiales bacterium]|nr:hypothetical protein [Longimicrobiales bacterium]